MNQTYNLALAKRIIVDYIYKSARLEDIIVTYPETAVIYEGLTVQGKKTSEVLAIHNLKYAWKFVFGTLEEPVTLNYICHVNKLVGSSGELKAPEHEQISDKLMEIQSIPNAMDRCLSLMLYLMRTQIFFDGNKRTAMLIANKEMIRQGLGVITIDPDDLTQFFELLLTFYETNDNEAIKAFLYERAIDGLNFES